MPQETRLKRSFVHPVASNAIELEQLESRLFFCMLPHAVAPLDGVGESAPAVVASPRTNVLGAAGAAGGVAFAVLPWKVSPVSAVPSLSRWTSATPAPVALAEVAGGIIGGRLYLVGGSSDVTLAYDFGSESWLAAGALDRRQFTGDHHAAEVVGGKLHLIGGLGSGGSQGRVQIYDPAKDEWTLGAAMPFAAGSISTALIGGKIYAAGGIVGASFATQETTNRTAVYDPATDKWSELAAMPAGRNHAAAGTDGGKLYVFGGRGPGSGDNNVVANGFDTVQVYDPATNTWASSDDAGSSLVALPQARGGMGKAAFVDGEFHVIGGETLTGAGATSAGVYPRVDVYDPASNSWRLAAPLPTPRHGIFPLAAGDNLHVIAGGTKAGASSSMIHEVLAAFR